MGTDVQEEFAPECPRCSALMLPVVAQGLLGFQKCMVPAYRCKCQETVYPITSEEEFQSWVALVILEDAPQVLVTDGSELTLGGPWVRTGAAIPICRDCEALLQEGCNPYEDGWFCSRCGTYDLDPMTRAEIPGFATITSKHAGVWKTEKPDGD
jgi:hypothetical protein